VRWLADNGDRCILQDDRYRSQYSFCQDIIMQAEILLTLKLQQRLFADPRRIALLKQIDSTGSISQGRKTRALAIKAHGTPSMR
jgi:molybdate transport system regulatory protein